MHGSAKQTSLLHNLNKKGNQSSWAGTRNQGGDVGATHATVITSSLRVSAADILVCVHYYTIFTFFFLNIVCQSAEVAATLNIHLAAAGG